VTGERPDRRLAAILAADVAGYSRLMGADEVGTLASLKAARREIVDPAIAEHKGRIVKTTGDGMLVEFASAVDAVVCAMDVQAKMAKSALDGTSKIAFRIGINIGDIIIDGEDIFGDGVNVAARVESECEPGGVCLSGSAFEQVRGKTDFNFDDLGERALKNIDRPVRIYAARRLGATTAALSPRTQMPLPLPDKPSIVVLPFQNMSGDPEQDYFADGMVEEITTALSRSRWLFVIARNSAFTYKGKAIDIKRVGRELGVRYVLEGSVRRSGSRVRITGQLIEVATQAHIWATVSMEIWMMSLTFRIKWLSASSEPSCQPLRKRRSRLRFRSRLKISMHMTSIFAVWGSSSSSQSKGIKNPFRCS
jgi:adenylate cyclase